MGAFARRMVEGSGAEVDKGVVAVHRPGADDGRAAGPGRGASRLAVVLAAVGLFAVAGCADPAETSPVSPSTEALPAEASTPSGAPSSDVARGEAADCWSPLEMLDPEQVPEAGFEILERRDDGTTRAWMSPAITLAEFDALELPAGWSKNQPRGGGGPDEGVFCGSPGSPDGQMVLAEHVGHEWAHVATIVEVGVPLDTEGLLLGAMIEKEHQVTYRAGSTTPILISPEGDLYPLVSRDARRATDESPVPQGWRVVEHTFTEDHTARLPNPTLNIRVQNQDSYQGPLTGLVVDR